MRWLGPERVATLTTLRRTQPVERKSKRNANQPSAKPITVTKTMEAFVSPEEGFLGHVFGIGGVAQNSARYAKGQWPAFGKALFELPPDICPSCLAHQLAPCPSDWLVQNQLLHRIPSKPCSTRLPGQSKCPPRTTTRRHGAEFGSR